MAAMTKTSAYIWFDTEYTDLDLDRARLLQVAAIATDSQLNRLLRPDQDLMFFVRLPDDEEVSPWIREHLSDVVATCRSGRAVDVEKVDVLMTEWLARVVEATGGGKDNRPVLAGNSVHADWFLARKYLPKFLKGLHYRVLDVTTLKLLWQDWLEGAKFDKENAALVGRHFPGACADIAGKPHDAYYDVQASIAELSYYRLQVPIAKRALQA